jgi:hypothetical protein
MKKFIIFMLGILLSGCSTSTTTALTNISGGIAGDILLSSIAPKEVPIRKYTYKVFPKTVYYQGIKYYCFPKGKDEKRCFEARYTKLIGIQDKTTTKVLVYKGRAEIYTYKMK